MQTTATHRDLQGNHACALGAIAAGCKFFAGYPITPSSEIAERMSIELPRNSGTFIQMEMKSHLWVLLLAPLWGV